MTTFRLPGLATLVVTASLATGAGQTGLASHPPSAQAANSAQAAQSAHRGYATYVVRPGDSLWAISRARGLSVAQLATANTMRPSDVLIIGRRLRIPTRSGGAGGSGLAAGGKGGGHSATTAAVATRAGSATAASDFCETFTPTAGPRRVLPAALAANPGRLALRPLFVRWSEQYGVPAALTEAIAWQESGWQVGAVSSAQAVGVGQLLPTTADFVSHQLIGTNLDITTANDNIRMSARYLAYLQSEEGSICRTVAAYYEGSANMARFGVFPETEPYVASVEALVPRFD